MSLPYTLHLGDCLEVLRALPDNSVDSVVCDPPYGLSKEPDMAEVMRHWLAGDDYRHNGAGFMGKTWDSFVPGPSVWKECLRVLKPGGHLLAFFGSRTYDMGALAIRLAGFEIRDMGGWLYGSGFPKSHNLEGDWAGWGSALKPAHEPIAFARKPFKGTLAANVLAHGTGALNIDGCRVGWPGGRAPEVGTPGWGGPAKKLSAVPGQDGDTVERTPPSDLGRWPANLIHDGSDEVVALFPHTKSGVMKAGTRRAAQDEPGSVCYGTYGGNATSSDTFGDEGSAARFFYCAKTSRADRNEGLPSSAKPAVGTGAPMRELEDADWSARNGNSHPTVKPTDLMAYLCRLVTPPGGVVLDPFMGSGSTGKAAMREGFRFIGCELSPEYLAIAEARIAHELGRATSVIKESADTAAQLALFNDSAK